MSTQTSPEPNPNLNSISFPSNMIQDFYDYYHQDFGLFSPYDDLNYDFTSSNNNYNNNNTNIINTFASSSSSLPKATLHHVIMADEKSNNSTAGSSTCSSDGILATSAYNMKCKREVMKGPNNSKTKVKREIAFRTKTDLEVLDDGYKWRKYGKKKVKSNSHLRNYYKCSNGGCGVKKKIERDREDSKYLITTYEGVHNHESLCVIYYQDHQIMPINLIDNSNNNNNGFIIPANSQLY